MVVYCINCIRQHVLPSRQSTDAIYQASNYDTSRRREARARYGGRSSARGSVFTKTRNLQGANPWGGGGGNAVVTRNARIRIPNGAPRWFTSFPFFPRHVLPHGASDGWRKHASNITQTGVSRPDKHRPATGSGHRVIASKTSSRARPAGYTCFGTRALFCPSRSFSKR